MLLNGAVILTIHPDSYNMYTVVTVPMCVSWELLFVPACHTRVAQKCCTDVNTDLKPSVFHDRLNQFNMLIELICENLPITFGLKSVYTIVHRNVFNFSHEFVENVCFEKHHVISPWVPEQKCCESRWYIESVSKK